MFAFLACQEFNDAHSGVNIAEKLDSILRKHGIEKKLFMVLTDNAKSMIKGLYSVAMFLIVVIIYPWLAVRDLNKIAFSPEADDSSDEEWETESTTVDEATAAVQENILTIEASMEATTAAASHYDAIRLPCVAHKVSI